MISNRRNRMLLTLVSHVSPLSPLNPCNPDRNLSDNRGTTLWPRSSFSFDYATKYEYRKFNWLNIRKSKLLTLLSPISHQLHFLLPMSFSHALSFPTFPFLSLPFSSFFLISFPFPTFPFLSPFFPSFLSLPSLPPFSPFPLPYLPPLPSFPLRTD